MDLTNSTKNWICKFRATCAGFNDPNAPWERWLLLGNMSDDVVVVLVVMFKSLVFEGPCRESFEDRFGELELGADEFGSLREVGVPLSGRLATERRFLR